MTDRHDPTDDWRELADAALDGRATPDQTARLDRLLRDDPDARAFYAEYAGLHAELSVAWPEAEAAPPRRPPARLRWATAGAAVLLAGIGLGWAATAGPRPVATLTEARACLWLDGDLPTREGASLPPGRLRLAEGVARLLFASGAVVTLEGPTEVDLMTAGRCRLTAGRLVARVEDGATGFVVETPSAVLKDQGTEFGVHVRDAAVSDVQVFEGMVDVRHRASGANRTVRGGESVRLGGGGIVALVGEESGHPAGAPGRPSVRVTTADGRGADGFVASGNPVVPGTPNVLYVKHILPDDGPYQRKAYLRFDLAGVGPVAAADLSLTLVPGDMGFATAFPDATFAVYGLTDDALDDWHPAILTWAIAPANRPGGAALDPAKAVLLGRFAVASGVTRGEFGVGGPPLAEFLNRDANRLATMVVVRETAVSRQDSLIHCFAGRDYLRAAPPTLTLTPAR